MAWKGQCLSGTDLRTNLWDNLRYRGGRTTVLLHSSVLVCVYIRLRATPGGVHERREIDFSSDRETRGLSKGKGICPLHAFAELSETA